MSKTEGTALVLTQLENDPSTVFKALLNRDPFTRLVVRENPGAALAALQQGEEKLGLSQPAAARALDEVLETFHDLGRAREMMDANLMIERQVELIEAGGDLERSAAMIAGHDALHITLLNTLLNSTAFRATLATNVSENPDDDDNDDAEEDDPEQIALEVTLDTNLDRCVSVFRVARKLTENPCFTELLEADLGGLTLRQILMLAVWDTSDRPSNAEDVMASLMNEVGLDRDVCMDDLKQLIASQRILELNFEDAERIRQEILIRKNGDDKKPEQASSVEPTLDLG